MSFKERVYSFLIVSVNEQFNIALSTLLPPSTYNPVHFVSNVSAAKRAFSERDYDFVLVNSPLPDDIGTRFAIDCCRSKGTVVLNIVKNDIHEMTHDKVAEYGVFTLSKPTSKSTMEIALKWMISSKERLRQVEKKSSSLEDKMAEIRLVNRAKWLLIGELNMSEPDAHRYIEKQAMDNGVTKREIAENIIKTYS